MNHMLIERVFSTREAFPRVIGTWRIQCQVQTKHVLRGFCLHESISYGPISAP